MNTIQYKNLIQEAPAQFAKLFCLLIITTALAACGGSNGSNGSSGSSGSSYSVTKISTLEELREYLYVPEAENDFLLGNAHEAGAFSQIDLTEYFDDTCPRGVLTTNIDLGGLTLNNKYNHRTSYCMRLMGDGYTISNMSVSIIETLEPWHSIQDITFLSTRRNQDLVCGTSRIYRYCLYFRNDKSSIVLLGMHRGIEDGRLRNVQFDDTNIYGTWVKRGNGWELGYPSQDGGGQPPPPPFIMFTCIETGTNRKLIDCENNDSLYGNDVGSYGIIIPQPRSN